MTASPPPSPEASRPMQAAARVLFLDDGSVQVRTGRVELGQGVLTAFTQIAADALGLPPQMVHVLPADTAFGPDEGVTSGSLSVQEAGAALRRACEAARRAPAGGAPAPVVGSSLPRVDLPAKLAGEPAFIHDLGFAGMLHGRVLHPPHPQAALDEDGLESALRAARGEPGVLAARRDGRLLGVLALSRWQAERAAQRLAAGLRWSAPDDAPAPGPATPRRVAEHGALPAEGVARTLRARYAKPWIAHASIGPSCALARWSGDGLQVWTHSQGIFNLRRDLALAFGLDAAAVRVRHIDGAGCYGHNGADDVAWDAAWLAREAPPGRPVRVLWSRRDDFTLAPLGPAMDVELEADLDAHGEVLHWRHRVASPGHSIRPGRSTTPALLGSWQTALPFAAPAPINVPLAAGGGAERNALPAYRLPGWTVECIDRPAPAPLRASALRSLGAFANVFAAESFVDEIAQATGTDPLEWRRRHLAGDARALAVLEAAAQRAGYAGRVRSEGRGMGLGIARYKGSGAWCAVVAEVEAAASLRVRRLTIAVDVGVAINPDGVIAQIEGGAIQATSWTLLEAVAVESGVVATDAWSRYPILRFSQVPEVDVTVIDSREASVGAGEAALGPTAAAIANALADALGVRVRELPLTPERIVATMG